MGLVMSRIHFEKGLPSIEKINDQFKKQTGLSFWITADLNLLELPLNNLDVIKTLYQDLEKYKNFRNKDSYNGEKTQEESKEINHISHFQFSNPLFYNVSFQIKGKTIIMSYGIGQYYFSSSLEKSLYDLGGNFEGFDGEVKEDWTPPKAWEKLKHWREYKWYNRPSRKYNKPFHKRILSKMTWMVLEATYYIKEKLV